MQTYRDEIKSKSRSFQDSRRNLLDHRQRKSVCPTVTKLKSMCTFNRELMTSVHPLGQVYRQPINNHERYHIMQGCSCGLHSPQYTRVRLKSNLQPLHVYSNMVLLIGNG